jgi:hypothetical protein
VGEGVFQSAYVQLLTGFLDKLIWYAKLHRVKVTHFVATAWTAEGRRMCEHFAMTEVGRDQFGDRIFELDVRTIRSDVNQRIVPPLRRLLRVYAELDL